MKKLLLSAIVITAAIMTAIAVTPEAEFSFITPEAGRETETVVSWNYAGSPSYNADHDVMTIRRHFSIEKYQDGDITDGFRVTFDEKEYKPETDNGYKWKVFYMEGFQDIDEAWINIEIGF